MICVLLVHLLWFLIASFIRMQAQSFCFASSVTQFSKSYFFVRGSLLLQLTCIFPFVSDGEAQTGIKKNILSYPSLALPCLMLGPLLKSTFVCFLPPPLGASISCFNKATLPGKHEPFCLQPPRSDASSCFCMICSVFRGHYPANLTEKSIQVMEGNIHLQQSY